MIRRPPRSTLTDTLFPYATLFLSAFAKSCAVVTYEFENIPFDPVAALARLVPVRPGTKVLRISQDRLFEKDFCSARGIGTAPYRAVANVADLCAAATAIGLPLVLKTRRMEIGRAHV